MGGFIGVERITHALTDGFTIYRTLSNHPDIALIDYPEMSETETKDLKALLSQDFHYLSCGSQSFVFRSDDNQYVIKFIKHHRFRTSWLLKHLPLPKGLSQSRHLRIDRKLCALKDTINSFIHSYTDFKDETGTLYIHPEHTEDLDLKLTVVDKLKIRHTIDLDKVEFIVQRMAQPASSVFLNFKENNQDEMAKEAFDELLTLSERRSIMGFYDKDPNLIKNFGFIGAHAIELDAGGFIRYDERDPDRFYTKEIHRIRAKALPWFKKHYPEIAPYVQEQIEALVIEKNIDP